MAAGMGHIKVTKRLLENGAQMEAKEYKLFTWVTKSEHGIGRIKRHPGEGSSVGGRGF